MPKRRTPIRKTEHSVIERRRREKINDRLTCLQEMVPACREQAYAYFQRKSPGGAASDRARTELVLEKLCIISHTVDYIAQLQKQLEAYRTPGHDPPEVPTPQATQEAHRAFAHDDQGTCVCLTSSASSDNTSHDSEAEECARAAPPLTSAASRGSPEARERTLGTPSPDAADGPTACDVCPPPMHTVYGAPPQWVAGCYPLPPTYGSCAPSPMPAHRCPSVHPWIHSEAAWHRPWYRAYCLGPPLLHQELRRGGHGVRRAGPALAHGRRPAWWR